MAGELAFTNGIYNVFKVEVMRGTFNLTAAAIKVMLMTGHTPAATHATITAVKASGAEFSGTGYTARGKVFTSPTLADDGGQGKFDAADTVWTSLAAGNGPPSHAIMYLDSGTDGTSIPIMCWVLGTAANGSNYTLIWGATGILRMQT